MADDNFFSQGEQVQPEVPQEPPKIKVGEDEYTQEELSKLVGLGKIGREAEEKYKTRIDKVWPKFQQTINEKQAVEQELTRLRDQASRPVQTSNQLTPEQIKAEAIKQAEELGIGPQAIRKTVVDIVQGQRLLDSIEATIDNYKADGLPETTVDDVLQHMSETGIKNPDKAYRDMFEKEWLQSQTDKINKLRQPGMPTVEHSTAGSKQPAQVDFHRMKENQLADLVAEALNGNR